MDSILEGDIEDLKIKAIIGFDGSTISGLRMHPDGKHLIYPLGNKVTILHWDTKQQEFLSGHTNIISAIDVSKSGKYIASGQINHIGFRALVIIWNYETKSIYTKHEVHKVRVEAVRFTIGEHYLISLGGRDCSSLVVWDICRDKPLCGAPASKGTQGEATTMAICSKREVCFVTGGDGTLTVWKIDPEEHKLYGTDVNVSKLRRCVLCLAVCPKDELLYCGTATGDVLKVRLNYHHDPEVLDPTSPPIMFGCYAKVSNRKVRSPIDMVDLFPGGVRALLILDKKILLIGGGDGTINKVKEIENPIKGHSSIKLPSTPELQVLNETNVRAMVTSLVQKDPKTVLAGTVASEIFSICLKTFEIKLLVTCHVTTIYDVAFPHKFSEVFATASKNDVRVWNMNSMQELLRIKVENFCCSGVVFSHDGKAIITGWNDGIIRSFTPLTGRLIYTILNAHNKGVSAIAVTADDKTIISGGCEGQVRLWDIGPCHQTLICTLKEHKGPVSAIHINKFSDEAVSASTDGTCIIWDLIRKCRKQILFANTLFMCVRYYPSAVQILTSGSDRKIAYWEVYDGSLIREMEGSRSAGINTLDISPDGSRFVTGGNDQMIKLWRYHEGVTTHVGTGHSAVITAVTFSPNCKYIISCSATGSIFVWECPHDPLAAQEEIKDDETIVKAAKDNDENISDIGTARQEELKRKCSCKMNKK